MIITVNQGGTAGCSGPYLGAGEPVFLFYMKLRFHKAKTFGLFPEHHRLYSSKGEVKNGKGKEIGRIDHFPRC